MSLQAHQERPAVLSEEPPVEMTQRSTTARRAWLGALAFPIGICLMSRIVVVAAAAMATWLARPLHVTQALTGWDGGWYVEIARSGYPGTVAVEGTGNRWAFFPALPAVIRGVARATGLSYEHAGILVALLFALTAAVAVWLAVRRVFGNRVADRTVAVLCFFPTAYTLSMVYTEGLFITAAALCIWLLHEQRWTLAGLAATGAGLTRSVGAVLVLACLVIGLRAVWQGRSTRPLAAIVVAPLGLLAWMFYQWHRVGTPFAFIKAEAAWSHHFIWFSSPFQASWRLLTDRSDWKDAGDVLGASAVVIVLATGALLVYHHLRRSPIPLAWWIFTVGGVLAAFSPFWPTSVPRYVMAVFPLLAMLAVYVPRRLEGSLLATMALLQGVLATIAFASILTYQTAPFAP